MNAWKKVFATHEEKQSLSRSEWLGDNFPGVALPSAKAMTKWVMIRYKDKFTCAQVRDVGPWCEDDDLYVFGGGRPRAEIFKGEFCMISDEGKLHSIPSNGAGIDLFPATAKNLGIPLNENVNLEWCFIQPGE